MMKRAGTILAAVALGAAAALAAPVLMNEEGPARAAVGECNDQWVNDAVFEVTGHTAEDGACIYRLYNNGNWQTYNELKGYVAELENACGTHQTYQNIAWAVVEHTGIRPTGGTCSTQPWQEWVDAKSGGSKDIDWNSYDDPAGVMWSIESAVLSTLSECASRQISHAVISVTYSYPDTRSAHQPAGLPNPNNHQIRGQCDGGLYNSFGWTTNQQLRQFVADRVNSSANCTIPGQNEQVDDAYLAMTGWHPLASECDLSDNFVEFWGTDDEKLKRLIWAGKRCSNDPHMGQLYLKIHGRHVRGRHTSGECNFRLYGGIFLSDADKANKVDAVGDYLQANGLVFDDFGRVTAGGVRYPADEVWIAAENVVSKGNGSYGAFETADGDEVEVTIQPTGPTPPHQLTPDSMLVLGGAKVIGTGGLNVIGTGGLNLIGQAGGNLISDKGLG